MSAAWVQAVLLHGLIGAMGLLPYRARLAVGGWLVTRIVAPLAGYRRRIRANLALVWPDLPQAEVDRLVIEVPRNVGRSLVEVYSAAEFKARLRDTPVTGPGLPAILQAHAQGRGVILVSGHFGNYDVPRAVLSARGHAVGALYRPLGNPYLDATFHAAIEQLGKPVFARGRRGLAEMVAHLRGGGLVGLLMDQSMSHGETLQFFGHPAKTALSAAELALKYNCLLVAAYGVRQADPTRFTLIVEAPVPVSDRRTMTQSLNDSLEAQIRAHPAQWMWIHRRWK